jgi:2-methylcitrate dehydratase PrpD
MTDRPLTATLAAHVDQIALERLPSEVIEKAKLCVLDALGCAMAGAGHGAIKSLLGATRPRAIEPGAMGASVWRAGLKTGGRPPPS